MIHRFSNSSDLSHLHERRIATMNAECLIKAHDISMQFGDRQVLQHVSVSVHRGQVLTLIGPNGAGKTTLVRIMLGLLKPHAGVVEKPHALRIGYMPQKMHIEPTMPLTVKRFLELTNDRPRLPVGEILEEVKVSHLFHHQVRDISGGELQRVLLARAMLQSPQLLVLDEPAQGVDVSGQAELYQLINDLRTRHQCGVLMISHDLHLVMAKTDEVVCLNHHICCHGRPEQVSVDPSYLALFGKREAKNIAVYTHHHNHHHAITGEVVEHHHE